MTLSNDETYLRVRKVLSSMLKIKEDEIKLDSNLRDQLGVDSVDIMDIIVRMEKEFSLEAPDDFNPQIKTVDDIVSVIEDLKKIAS